MNDRIGDCSRLGYITLSKKKKEKSPSFLACSLLCMKLSASILFTAKIISGKSGIRIVFRKAFLPLQALKSYLQPPVFPGESQSVNQVLA